MFSNVLFLQFPLSQGFLPIQSLLASYFFFTATAKNEPSMDRVWLLSTTFSDLRSPLSKPSETWTVKPVSRSERSQNRLYNGASRRGCVVWTLCFVEYNFPQPLVVTGKQEI